MKSGLLERGGDMRFFLFGNASFIFHFAILSFDCIEDIGLKSDERNIVMIVSYVAGINGVAERIAFFRQRVDSRAARVAKAQQRGDLVKSFSDGVIYGGPDQLIAAYVQNMDHESVAAGDHKA